jgi:hypothetical protein
MKKFLLAAVVSAAVLVIAGCKTDAEPARDDSSQGIMIKATADLIFDWEIYGQGVEIIEFLGDEPLREYLAGNSRAASSRLPKFKIGTIDGRPVTRIGEGAFSVKAGAPDISKIVSAIDLPDTIEELGARLFEGAAGKVTLNIPKAAVDRITEEYSDRLGLDAEAAWKAALGEVLEGSAVSSPATDAGFTLQSTAASYEADGKAAVAFTFDKTAAVVTDVTEGWTVTGTGSSVIKAVYEGDMYGTKQTVSLTASGGGGSAEVSATVLAVRPFPTGGAAEAYTITYYDSELHAAAVQRAADGAVDGFLVPAGWQKLFNAVYTPNAPKSTDTVETGKTAVPYNEEISAAALKLFRIRIGGNAAAGDRVEIGGAELPAADPGAGDVAVIDLGLPGGADNSGVNFVIRDRGLGAEDGDYGHLRLRVNKGADLVIRADNSEYISGGIGFPCPDGWFNRGSVEVAAGGRLRNGAYEGFPLGLDAVILSRWGSYLGIGPEAADEDAKAVEETYADWYAGWLVGPSGSGAKIVWDAGGSAGGGLEARAGMLAVSSNVTVKKTVGLAHNVWLIGGTTITIDAGAGAGTIPFTEGKKGLFANGAEYKIYGTTNKAKLVVKTGSALHSVLVTGSEEDAAKVVEDEEAAVTITLKAEKGGTSTAGYPDEDGVIGYFDWTLPD